MKVFKGIFAALLLVACGGEESVASKSAAAYQEAQAKGNTEHGAHATPATATTDHAGHGTATAADHAAMGHEHGAATDHAAMDHGVADHAQHGEHRASGGHETGAHDQHAAMQHDQQAPAQHDQHAPAQHAQHQPSDPHAQHAMPRPSAPPAAVAEDMRSVTPSSTLQADIFDTPAATSVSEAAKATQSGGHEGHQMRGITPGEDRENPPTPMPATRDRTTSSDHTGHGDQAAIYVCPMHPEVTSDKPGDCPKCGMALVKKD